MSIFKRNKKKETDTCCCGKCDAESAAKTDVTKSTDAKIKVLGGGCPNCFKLEEAVKEALVRLGIDSEIEHVTDYAQIAAYGVMTTPALVIDGKVVSSGRVLKTEEVVKILQDTSF